MIKFSNTKDGFTLVEVLVSTAILLTFLPFAANMLTNSQLMASYSKHKIQAAYAAQEILENYRQTPFANLVIGTTLTTNVLLDTKGNYNNTLCNVSGVFCGTTNTTITQAVYTNSAGVQSPPSATVDHVVVKIYWNEPYSNSKIKGSPFIPMTETYAEDIVNDTMLN